jgi:hypothetical protein
MPCEFLKFLFKHVFVNSFWKSSLLRVHWWVVFPCCSKKLSWARLKKFWEESSGFFCQNIGCFEKSFYRDNTFRNDVEKQTKNIDPAWKNFLKKQMVFFCNIEFFKTILRDWPSKHTWIKSQNGLKVHQYLFVPPFVEAILHLQKRVNPIIGFMLWNHDAFASSRDSRIKNQEKVVTPCSLLFFYILTF